MSITKKQLDSLNLARDERGSLMVPTLNHHLPHLGLPHLDIPHLEKKKLSLPHIKIKYIVLAVAAIVQTAGIVFGANYLLPQDISFSYAQTNCFTNPMLFPGAHTQTGTAYRVSHSNDLTIAGRTVFSSLTCVEAAEAPQPGTAAQIALAPLGNPIISKKIKISPEPLPSIDQVFEMPAYLSTIDPLLFKLDSKDGLFAYQLTANDDQVACKNDGDQVECDVSRLALEQGQSYEFILYRLFDAKRIEPIFTQSVKTVTPIRITDSSIPNGSIAYNIPESVTLSLNKTGSNVSDVALKNISSNTEIDVLTDINDKELIISFLSTLPRQADFELSVGDLRAEDNGALSKPYVLNFTTSGGPKVIGTSFGSTGVQTYQNLTLTFDSDVAADQALSNFISLKTSTGKASFSASVSGKSVIIDPTESLPWCSPFTLTVADGLKNSHGITGGSEWAFSSRTICYTTTVIGQSVQGRSIVAYHFGSGASKILYLGNMHGSEASSKFTLDSWVSELDANINKIPAHRSIIVIPTINPDGFASDSRFNANGVDLNRNFAEANWQKDTGSPEGTIAGGGGTAPLSEPEAAALASFIQAQSPRAVLSYHAVASVIIANEAGDSISLGNTYSSLSGYWLPSPSQSPGVFSYDITGTLEGWLYESLGIPTLVVELSTYSGNEIYKNRDAMWAMATLP